MPQSFRAKDGWVFCYEITSRYFSLKLFRAILLARIRLQDIKYIRQRSGEDVRQWIIDSIIHPFRTWYWPHPFLGNTGLRSAPYIVRTQKGRRIMVRLKGGFHYQLRAAMGEARGDVTEASAAGQHGGGERIHPNEAV
jgi:hypothetical protein